MRTFIREWWVTFRYGSVFTKAGRNLRATLAEPFDEADWIEVQRPGSGEAS